MAAESRSEGQAEVTAIQWGTLIFQIVLLAATYPVTYWIAKRQFRKQKLGAERVARLEEIANLELTILYKDSPFVGPVTIENLHFIQKYGYEKEMEVPLGEELTFRLSDEN